MTCFAIAEDNGYNLKAELEIAIGHQATFTASARKQNSITSTTLNLRNFLGLYKLTNPVKFGKPALFFKLQKQPITAKQLS